MTAVTLIAATRSYAASWFAQQAAEKGLKAMFIDQQNKLAPRTHDLEFLGEILSVPREIAEALAIVNPAFDLSRYPDPVNLLAPVDQVSPEVAKGHFEASERIMRWLTEQLQSNRR